VAEAGCNQSKENTGSPSTMETLPFVFTFCLLTPLLAALHRRSTNKWQCQGSKGKDDKEKGHVAMFCRQMSLASTGLACLSKLPSRAHQTSPLAAEYAPLEAPEPFASHSDPRINIARSPHL
jgi:hypothetical protein